MHGLRQGRKATLAVHVLHREQVSLVAVRSRCLFGAPVARRVVPRRHVAGAVVRDRRRRRRRFLAWPRPVQRMVWLWLLLLLLLLVQVIHSSAVGRVVRLRRRVCMRRGVLGWVRRRRVSLRGRGLIRRVMRRVCRRRGIFLSWVVHGSTIARLGAVASPLRIPRIALVASVGRPAVRTLGLRRLAMSHLVRGHHVSVRIATRVCTLAPLAISFGLGLSFPLGSISIVVRIRPQPRSLGIVHAGSGSARLFPPGVRVFRPAHVRRHAPVRLRWRVGGRRRAGRHPSRLPRRVGRRRRMTRVVACPRRPVALHLGCRVVSASRRRRGAAAGIVRSLVVGRLRSSEGRVV